MPGWASAALAEREGPDGRSAVAHRQTVPGAGAANARADQGPEGLPLELEQVARPRPRDARRTKP
eukprot:8949836-Pyramimonas_sp.AAC.1